MAYFPMFVELENKKCLIVGGGKVALRKVMVLQDFGAIIEVVAEDICGEIKEICSQNTHITYRENAFLENDLDEIFLVVAATDDTVLNHEISVSCKKRGIYVNAVDQTEDCGFIFPSYIRQGNVVGAFSSGGQSPVITQYLKNAGKEYLTPFIGELADFLGSIRSEVKMQVLEEEKRKEIYRGLLQQALATAKIPEREDWKGQKEEKIWTE